MKKTNLIRKSLACVISAVTLCVSMSGLANQPLKANAASYGTRERTVEIAQAQVGKSLETLWNEGVGIPDDEWCAYFASWCVNSAGGTTYSSSGSSTKLMKDYIGSGHFHSKRQIGFTYEKNGTSISNDQLKACYDPNYTPKPGDIALVENANGWGDGPDHTVVVEWVEGTGIDATIHTIEGNLGNDTNKYAVVGRDWWKNMVWGYCSPTYSGSATTPSTPVQSKLTFNNMTYPTRLRAGSSFNVYGIISSNVPINKVTVDILLKNTNGSWSCVDSTTRNMFTLKYDLHTIDDRIWFNRANIRGRQYMYRVTAWDSMGQHNFERYFTTY